MTTEKRVEVFVPRGAIHDEPNLFVGVNGVSYLLPKGQASQVPLSVARELELSRKAQEIRDRNMEDMLQEARG